MRGRAIIENIKVGIIGSGFMGKGLYRALVHQKGVIPSCVLTRANIGARGDFPSPSALTNSIDEVIDKSDIIVECAGDAVYATDMVEKALKAYKPVVTLDPILHITSGSYLATLGWFSEAEGDQPGCLATLANDLTTCGFTPIVYGNNKGFLNYRPTQDDMEVWSKRLGISLKVTVSNTDGTNVQIELALVANWFGATIAYNGMRGIRAETLFDAAAELTELATDTPISDFVIPEDHVPGVFIVATYDDPAQQPYLKYLKLGDGPNYLFSTNHHLCHLEVVKTIKQWASGENGVLLNNGSRPTISVAACTKWHIDKGDIIGGVGTFNVRGKAIKIKDFPSHVPIGLMGDYRAKRPLPPNHTITFDDVDIPDSLALRAWCEYHA